MFPLWLHLAMPSTEKAEQVLHFKEKIQAQCCLKPTVCAKKNLDLQLWLEFIVKETFSVV